MGSAGFALVLLVSFLFLSSITSPCVGEEENTDDAESHHHHHHHHETPPASEKSPVGSPPQQRKLVAVQGVVYCKPCKYRGVDTLTGAAPLTGAVVKLQCNGSKNLISEQAKTDKNGYFFFIPRQLTTSGARKCKVSLVSSSLPTCSVATGLHGGDTGASLVPAAASDKSKKLYHMFTVGPFAFEPTKDSPCP